MHHLDFNRVKVCTMWLKHSLTCKYTYLHKNMPVFCYNQLLSNIWDRAHYFGHTFLYVHMNDKLRSIHMLQKVWEGGIYEAQLPFLTKSRGQDALDFECRTRGSAMMSISTCYFYPGVADLLICLCSVVSWGEPQYLQLHVCLLRSKSCLAQNGQPYVWHIRLVKLPWMPSQV